MLYVNVIQFQRKDINMAFYSKKKERKTRETPFVPLVAVSKRIS